MDNFRNAALSGPGVLFLLGFLLLWGGCTTSATPVPPPRGTASATATSSGDPGPAGNAPAAPTLPAAEETPAAPQPPPATPTGQNPHPPDDALTLQVASPAHLSGLEVGFARVMGRTSGTLVSINGLPAGVAEDGHFQRDLSMREGVNLIEVVSSDESGRTASQQLTVYVVSPTASLPFTVLYPRDGLEVAGPTVTLVGVTRPDAVVGVNDIPVEIDASGIFSTDVALEPGANLIEVVAVDMAGNVRFQTVAVFYFP
jgi:hypothetical protein